MKSLITPLPLKIIGALPAGGYIMSYSQSYASVYPNSTAYRLQWGRLSIYGRPKMCHVEHGYQKTSCPIRREYDFPEDCHYLSLQERVERGWVDLYNTSCPFLESQSDVTKQSLGSNFRPLEAMLGPFILFVSTCKSSYRVHIMTALMYHISSDR